MRYVCAGKKTKTYNSHTSDTGLGDRSMLCTASKIHSTVPVH